MWRLEKGRPRRRQQSANTCGQNRKKANVHPKTSGLDLEPYTFPLYGKALADMIMLRVLAEGIIVDHQSGPNIHPSFPIAEMQTQEEKQWTEGGRGGASSQQRPEQAKKEFSPEASGGSAAPPLPRVWLSGLEKLREGNCCCSKPQ